jgi:hypothetical protein
MAISNRTNPTYTNDLQNNTATINHNTANNELEWMKPIILLFRAYS